MRCLFAFALVIACARPTTPAPVDASDAPTTMKALRIHGFGDESVLVYEDVPLPPPPAEGELRVRVRAVGVNPLDAKVRAGRVPGLFGDRFPFVLGWDVSGEVESVGGGVEGFVVGDPVFAMLALPLVVLDVVGGETLMRSIAITKSGGIVVSLVATPDPAALEARGVRGVRMVVRPDGAALAEIAALVDAGRVTPVVSEVHPLAEGAAAHRAVATGHTRGKIVLRVP